VGEVRPRTLTTAARGGKPRKNFHRKKLEKGSAPLSETLRERFLYFSESDDCLTAAGAAVRPGARVWPRPAVRSVTVSGATAAVNLVTVLVALSQPSHHQQSILERKPGLAARRERNAAASPDYTYVRHRTEGPNSCASGASVSDHTRVTKRGPHESHLRTPIFEHLVDCGLVLRGQAVRHVRKPCGHAGEVHPPEARGQHIASYILGRLPMLENEGCKNEVRF
jgi:hypothetical protein